MIRFIVRCVLLSTCAVLPVWSQSTAFQPAVYNSKGTVIAQGDFNGDGRQDLITASPSDRTHFNILKSTGDGIYAVPVTFALPYNGNANVHAVAADFNRDGKLDLAVVNGNTDVYVYLGNGDGSFRSPYGRRLGDGYLVLDVTAADFNRDGKPDLAFVGNFGANNTVATILGNGDGTFGTPQLIAYGHSVSQVLYGDFDADGRADLAVIANSCPNPGCGTTIALLFGDGAGHFTPPYQTSLNADLAVSAADVNKDGKMDLVATNGIYGGPQKSLLIFYGNSNRTLTQTTVATTFVAGTNENIQDAAVADFDGDGINDLAVNETNNSGTFYIAFLKGNGNRTFQPDQILYSTESQIVGVLPTRVNRDTKPDIALAQIASSTSTPPTVTLLINNSSGRFHTCNPPNAATGINVCAPGAASTVASPVAFRIGAVGPTSLRKVEVWVDGQKRKETYDSYTYYSFMDASIPLVPGSHTVTIFAAGWDNSLQRKNFSITSK